MIFGWIFGRYILDYGDGKVTVSQAKRLFRLGFAALAAFVTTRYFNDYGNMFLLKEDNSWQQWLHVSKYPPSASFIILELGLMAVILALMIKVEQRIGLRPNRALLVFGQTSMMFYLVHWILLTGTGTYGGMRDITDLSNT